MSLMDRPDNFGVVMLMVIITTATSSSLPEEPIRNRVLKIAIEKPNDIIAVRRLQDIGLDNSHNMGYSGEIAIGDPPQKVTVNFDSGSADLWVASQHMCRKERDWCRKNNVYNSSASKTHRSRQREVTLHYGSQEVNCIISTDDILIAGVRVKRQKFGEAKVVTRRFGFGVVKGGLLGLAYPSLSHIDKSGTLISNMMKQGVLDKAQIAFYLNTHSETSLGSERGELAIGGVDSTRFFKPIRYNPVIDKKYWKIRANGMVAGRKRVGPFDAVVDSGSSLIAGPPNTINPILIGIFGDHYGDYYSDVECSTLNITLPDVTIIINKVKYVLTSDDYMVKSRMDGEWRCLCGFRSYNLDFTILGNVFMRKYYTVFDLDQHSVGFALARN